MCGVRAGKVQCGSTCEGGVVLLHRFITMSSKGLLLYLRAHVGAGKLIFTKWEHEGELPWRPKINIIFISIKNTCLVDCSFSV